MNDIDTTFIDTPRDSRERTSLHLVSTGTRVRTEVMRRTAERITVTQALPFLKLRSGVRDADGRAASIEWVSVDIEGDTPALVMELVYEEPSREDATEQTRTAAAASFIPAVDSWGASDPMPARLEHEPKRRDDTVPYTFERAEARLEIAIAGASLAKRPAPQRPWLAAIADTFAAVAADLARAARELGHLLVLAFSR